MNQISKALAACTITMALTAPPTSASPANTTVEQKDCYRTFELAEKVASKANRGTAIFMWLPTAVVFIIELIASPITIPAHDLRPSCRVERQG